jgi:ubiquinone biosynthesis monooxygenase Coq7
LLNAHDAKSRAIVIAMKRDEARHATTALHMGAAELPLACKMAMRVASRVMTTIVR